MVLELDRPRAGVRSCDMEAVTTSPVVNSPTARLCECGAAFEPRAAHQKHCPSALCQARRFRKRYEAKHGRTYSASRWHRNRPPEMKRAANGLAPYVDIKAGVTRWTSASGLEYWAANIKVGRHKRARYFPIRKYGDSGARLLAALQRMMWLIELEVWRPEAGDPMAILSFTDLFRQVGSDEEILVEERDGPHIFKREKGGRVPAGRHRQRS